MTRNQTAQPQLQIVPPMRLRFSIAIDYNIYEGGAEFVFNVQAARTKRQVLIVEKLDFGRHATVREHECADTHTRLLRVTAEADSTPLRLRYDATVDIDHWRGLPASIDELAIADVPSDILQYIYPSRYCQSDRLLSFAWQNFSHLPRGYTRVQAICDWVATNVAFRSNTTDGTTSACDTLLERQGVCRDFAHLMIALCRALNIPARFATGIDYGADPALGPQDFHAYVEAYVGGRWFLFDPSGTAIPMGFIRLATGRDASDCAFATFFGNAVFTGLQISIEPVAGLDGIVREPVRTELALSSDGG